jgi:hypothetical protein
MTAVANDSSAGGADSGRPQQTSRRPCGNKPRGKKPGSKQPAKVSSKKPPKKPPGGPPPPPAPEGEPFEPAQNPTEAKAYAENVLQIEKVDYKGNLTIGNAVNAALTVCGRRGVRMPLEVAVDVAYFKASNPNAWAVYVPSIAVAAGKYNQAIACNGEKDWETLPDVTRDMSKLGYWSTGDPLHVIYYEAGHMAYHRHAPDAYSLPGKPGKPVPR